MPPVYIALMQVHTMSHCWNICVAGIQWVDILAFREEQLEETPMVSMLKNNMISGSDLCLNQCMAHGYPPTGPDLSRWWHGRHESVSSWSMQHIRSGTLPRVSVRRVSVKHLVALRLPSSDFWPPDSYGHLPVITGYTWDYTVYEWGYKYLKPINGHNCTKITSQT